MAKRRFNAKEFCSIQLSSQDEKDFNKWLGDKPPSQHDCALEFLRRGYKLSCTWVTDSNAFCLSVVGTEDCSHNQDAIMTSWSDDYVEAHQIALYKHLVICNDAHWPTQQSGKRWG